MFYKIIKDGLIVDVMSNDDIVYVKREPTSGRVLRARNKEDGAFGILSSDSNTYYSLKDNDEYPFVSTVEFYDESEYSDLKSQIEEQREVIYDSDDDESNVDITALKSVLMQQQAEQLMDLLAIITSDLSDEDIIKYPAFVEKWEDGKSYDAGKRLSYSGDVYKVVKSIGTSGATPDNSPAYYTKLN